MKEKLISRHELQANSSALVNEIDSNFSSMKLYFFRVGYIFFSLEKSDTDILDILILYFDIKYRQKLSLITNVAQFILGKK